MAAPTEHRCPACGALAATTGRILVPVGRPFVECPQCQAHVPRPPFDEWSGLPAESKLKLVLSGGVVATALGIVPGLLYALVALATDASAPRETLVAWVVVGVVLALAIWSQLLLAAVRGSQRRMRDPMYRARLAEYQMGRMDRGQSAPP